ncbi:hypothetical protein SLNSH_02215 [Alsobacter soli]|uniref:Blue-light-activated histidine kinase n=1 Tax=Alsobacter soli TaxID=2109933 RepID=A0A2T1HYF2_9HYPH|nr:hypothetical protein SLNSH_02215 [Alsobacter soli]
MRRRFPIAIHLAIFGLTILLPAAAAGALVAWRLASNERVRLERTAHDFVNDLSQDLDRELEVVMGSLQALATSPAFRSGDLESLDKQARQVAAQLHAAVLLRDSHGQQLLNTLVDWGTPLPVSTDADVLNADRRAISSGQPVVSNLFTGTLTGQRFVMVGLAIELGGKPGYVLSVSLTPEVIRESITSALTPPDWNASVVDGNYRIIARSRQHERFLGVEATRSFQENASSGRDLWRGVTLEGMEVVSLARRSRLAPWWVSVSVPKATLEAPMWQLMSGVAGLTGIGLAGSMALAFAYGRTLSGPIRAVARTAAGLARDEEAKPPESAIAEVQAISRALVNASDELRRRAQQRDAALRSAEAGEQRLRATYENAGVGIAEIDDQGRFVAVNDALCSITGYPRAELLGLRFSTLSAAEEVATDVDLFERQRQGEQTSYVVEKRFRRKDGAVRWVRLFSSAVSGPEGFSYAVRVVLDVTDERLASEHQALLIAELNHRVKNTLAVVQSLVAQTLKSTSSPAAFRDALTGRIMALARSHDLLSESEWKGATLDTLMRTTLNAHDGPEWLRATIEGPAVRVGPRAVVSLSLMAHELATNATKYGGLATPQGRLRVSWSVTEDNRTLQLQWRELVAGQAEPQAGRAGFGSRLIRLSIEQELNGRFETTYEGGFTLLASIPLEILAR